MAASGENLNEQQVLNHLLFHKAILSDDESSARVNSYIKLVKDSGEGAHVNIQDPFDRSIALAFELVLEKHLDPWNIDLVQFATLYASRLKNEADVDLITAGRLLLMAWTILKLQTEEVRNRAEPPPPPPPPEDDPWGFLPDGEWTESESDIQYTQAILRVNEVPLDEKIRHKGDRKVTLFELVEALEEARAEAELRRELNAKREVEAALRKQIRQTKAEGAAHKEDQEAEIQEIWQRIASMNGAPIPIKDLQQDKSREEVVKTLVSVLFLARASKVRVWQDNFPYGPIYVRNLNPAPHPEENGAGSN